MIAANERCHLLSDGLDEKNRNAQMYGRINNIRNRNAWPKTKVDELERVMAMPMRLNKSAPSETKERKQQRRFEQLENLLDSLSSCLTLLVFNVVLSSASTDTHLYRTHSTFTISSIVSLSNSSFIFSR